MLLPLLRFGAIALVTAFLAGPATAAGALRPSDPAPQLVGETLDGEPFDLAAERGHVVILNFWATWCPPCRAEMPTLNAFFLSHRADGVVLVGISADRPHDESEVRRVMHDFAYPALLARRATANGFGVPSVLPETIVLDAGGVVRVVRTPAGDAPITAAELDAAVAPLLASARQAS
jgi:thiol-disulfide isomerase/thioredoxin